jgi:hypothetical protein
MTWSGSLVAGVEAAGRIPCLQDGVPGTSRTPPGWDHLWIISGTNVISVAVPEI